MKLVTTFAGPRPARSGLDLVDAVWLQGPVADGVLNGDLVIKGNGDPKLVLERIWLLLRRVRQAGVREIRGDIVARPQRLRAGATSTRPTSTASRPALQRQRRRAAAQLPLGAADVHARSGARRRDGQRRSAARRRAHRCHRAAGRRPVRRLARRAAGRVRRSDAARASRRRSRRHAARRSGRWPTPIRRATTSAPLLGMWREIGGRLGGTACARPRAGDGAELRAALAAAAPRSCATSTSSATT